ncbi:uncharacterized protein N7529_001871 [Penicillium soppii]|uniref:uncharacterized protein n=1 Tax=Penicillium soppii TaxID=69789 RepID=UPI0025475174|nr:uncharacterized protein N7529_001871 [Penicillium soppii]KAJ5876287.1 hypothetical protein N7529_001871 [Penicillium soppii]
MMPKREPWVVKGRFVDGNYFDYLIGLSIENVEAILAQTMGDQSDDKCTNCHYGETPFKVCVQVPGMAACAPCHWGGLGFCCSFNSEKDIRKACNERVILYQNKFGISSNLNDVKMEITSACQKHDEEMNQLGGLIDSAEMLRATMAVLHKEHTRTANLADKIDNAHDILLQSTRCVLDTMKKKPARLEQYIEECKDLSDKVV